MACLDTFSRYSNVIHTGGHGGTAPTFEFISLCALWLCVIMTTGRFKIDPYIAKYFHLFIPYFNCISHGTTMVVPYIFLCVLCVLCGSISTGAGKRRPYILITDH
jgi:hypothetical protein